MNVRDSEIICGLLKREGYKIISDPKKADILLFNTCAVREHAEERVWSEIGRYKDAKLIGVIGCMAQEHKADIFERSGQVDFVAGPNDLDKIPGILKKLNNPGLLEKKVWETEGGDRPAEIYHTGFYEDKKHAYVVISEGCSNFCSYCVVPYVRSPIKHRDNKQILKEIEGAVDKGITSIMLLGQNVNSYQYNDVNFIKLLGLVEAVKGLKDLSFITSHPKDATIDLFKTMQDSGKIKKYLHLPVQSGSDRILELMNRGYSKRLYLDLVESYRKIVKGAKLTTDIIVGFPTETEEDFQETADLVKGVEFNSAYIFKYSVRPYTQAAKLPDDVQRKEKERRHGLILDLQRGISKKLK
jgi:tRNA-2-methylthio-N6-dimethylallyladenosine synthase